MAAKRIAGSSIKWQEILERVPKDQMPNYQLFKAKSDGYLRRMLANPAEAPQINWAEYEKKVPVAGMVKEFQSKYQSLKVPYPVDTLTSQVEAQEKQVDQEIKNYIALSNERIQAYQKEIDRIKALLPYAEMTMEDFRDAHPDKALDPINRPTFWPHTPEEQLGYKKEDSVKKSH